MSNLWLISEDSFDPSHQHHQETIFTIGNGYLSTRRAHEEGYPEEHGATFIHAVFDAAPISVTELANVPDWLPLTVHLNGERFSLTSGAVESFQRTLDLRTGVLTRTVRWRSPQGDTATIVLERFASLADPHTLFIRCRVTPEFAGAVEFRAALNGNSDNEGLAHWRWLGQGRRADVLYLHNRTRQSKIEIATAMKLAAAQGEELAREVWDAENTPTLSLTMRAVPGQELIVDKFVAAFTTRDVASDRLTDAAVDRVDHVAGWPHALSDNAAAWDREWQRTDVIIEGDDEAQIALRFNLFQMLVAAPRDDGRVNIGAKTLSGFGYRGHAFWDTEIFMLPLFTYTAPHIARNLLNYRRHLLPAAREKAKANGFEGALFPWESA
ncbi:MAG: glycoside hydrolase family 65 protein, partial [Chloroflexi bacterium]|nr:glycoside hydrolase family 65 protein [Chloroflexota bacterium]